MKTTKIEKQKKTKIKTKTEIKMNFGFRFQVFFLFCFSFCFCFLKGFAFLLTPRGLQVPQTVNCVVVGLNVPQRFCSLYVAQTLRLLYVSVHCTVNSLLLGLEVPNHFGLQRQMVNSLLIGLHRHMALSLIPIFRIQ